MRITFTMCVEPGDRFAPSAFESQIGKIVPFLSGSGVTRATLLAAKVAADGTEAVLTFDGDDLQLPSESISNLSFGFADDA